MIPGLSQTRFYEMEKYFNVMKCRNIFQLPTLTVTRGWKGDGGGGGGGPVSGDDH